MESPIPEEYLEQGAQEGYIDLATPCNIYVSLAVAMLLSEVILCSALLLLFGVLTA